MKLSILSRQHLNIFCIIVVVLSFCVQQKCHPTNKEMLDLFQYLLNCFGDYRVRKCVAAETGNMLMMKVVEMSSIHTCATLYIHQ